MGCDMVEFITNKISKATKDKTGLAHINKAYMDNSLPGTGASSSSIVTLPEIATNVIFHPSSNIAQQTFANYGWKIGTIVAPKATDAEKPKTDVQFETPSRTTMGNAGLHPISADGTADKAYISSFW